jgi:hypothetical protein
MATMVVAPTARAVRSCRVICISYSCSVHATQELIPLFAIYNQLSKRRSSKIVETVRYRHFSASLARTASACCTRFSASTPRISRTGTSSLFASCRITPAISRGSPSRRPSRPRNIFRNEPTEASYSGSKSGAPQRPRCDQRPAPPRRCPSPTRFRFP